MSGSDSSNNDEFGYRIDTTNINDMNFLIVGAYGVDWDFYYSSGAGYIFEYDCSLSDEIENSNCITNETNLTLPINATVSISSGYINSSETSTIRYLVLQDKWFNSVYFCI